MSITMSYWIDPNSRCETEGCTRPKATGEAVCSQCSRLARLTGTPVSPLRPGRRDSAPRAPATPGEESKPPRCIAYLSLARDVITLELTGEPKFTEADVEAVTRALSRLGKAA
jgi:hypothetical protein